MTAIYVGVLLVAFFGGALVKALLSERAERRSKLALQQKRAVEIPDVAQAWALELQARYPAVDADQLLGAIHQAVELLRVGGPCNQRLRAVAQRLCMHGAPHNAAVVELIRVRLPQLMAEDGVEVPPDVWPYVRWYCDAYEPAVNARAVPPPPPDEPVGAGMFHSRKAGQP